MNDKIQESTPQAAQAPSSPKRRMVRDAWKRDVWLSIQSTQQFTDCEPEKISLMTAAKLYRRNGKYYVAYDESQLTGMEGTRTTIKLNGKEVTMLRTGDCPSELMFAEGQTHVGLYHTGMGQPMTISTRTSCVENDIGQEGGMLTLEYTIEIDNCAVGHHCFEMLVATEEKE